MKDVPGVNILYEGSQEDIAKYFDGFREQAEKRVADGSYSLKERKLALREAYCWREAARVVRATQIKGLIQFPRRIPKTIAPAPKEALYSSSFLRNGA